MQDIQITIDMSKVMRLVRETAALYASKAIVKDPTAFARMEVSEPEESVLTNAARQARTYIGGVTRRYKMSCAENGASWNFGFKLPSNYDSLMTDAISGCISDYLQYTMLAEWFRLCGDVDRQKEFTEEAAASLQSIVTFINKRKAPEYTKPKMRRVQGMSFQ